MPDFALRTADWADMFLEDKAHLKLASVSRTAIKLAIQPILALIGQEVKTCWRDLMRKAANYRVTLNNSLIDNGSKVLRINGPAVGESCHEGLG